MSLWLEKKPDEYLYKNDELDCYIRDVIAADGKETHNTDKKTAKIPHKGATSKAIIEDAHGDYCLALKENQSC